MQLQHKHCMCMKVLLILKMRKWSAYYNGAESPDPVQKVRRPAGESQTQNAWTGERVREAPQLFDVHVSPRAVRQHHNCAVSRADFIRNRQHTVQLLPLERNSYILLWYSREWNVLKTKLITQCTKTVL